MNNCIQEDRIKDIEKENNKFKLQYNSSIILLKDLKISIEKIERNQKTAFKVILTSLISLVITLIKILFS